MWRSSWPPVFVCKSLIYSVISYCLAASCHLSEAMHYRTAILAHLADTDVKMKMTDAFFFLLQSTHLHTFLSCFHPPHLNWQPVIARCQIRT